MFIQYEHLIIDSKTDLDCEPILKAEVFCGQGLPVFIANFAIHALTSNREKETLQM